MSVRRSKRQLQNGTVRCTGCAADSDADYLHEKLKVPICGACSKAYTEGVAFDEYKKRMNMSSDSNNRCLWCSDMDSGLRSLTHSLTHLLTSLLTHSLIKAIPV